MCADDASTAQLCMCGIAVRGRKKHEREIDQLHVFMCYF